MATLLSPRYGIRRVSAHGLEAKLTSCGDGTFSLVIYRKGQPPEYHTELDEETASRLLRDFTYTLAEEKRDELRIRRPLASFRAELKHDAILDNFLESNL